MNYTFKVQNDRVEAGPYRVHTVCQEVDQGVEKAQVFLKFKHAMAMLVLTKGLDIVPNNLRAQNISV